MIKKDKDKEPDSDYCHGNWHKSKGISNNSTGLMHLHTSYESLTHDYPM